MRRSAVPLLLLAGVLPVACARLAEDEAIDAAVPAVAIEMPIDAARVTEDASASDATIAVPDVEEIDSDSSPPDAELADAEDSEPLDVFDTSSPDSVVDAFDDAPADSTDAAAPDAAPCIGPAPTDTIFVAPWGNDVTGNGSSACPTKTVTRALKLVTAPIRSVSLAHGTVVSPHIYGSGCTGGPPCDESIATTWSSPVLLTGSGTRDEVIVRGGAPFVISLSGGGVAAMTIESTNTMPYTRALAMSGFASPAPAYARDIRVRVSGAAFGVEVSSGPSIIGGGPGEGVEVIGGERGIALRFNASLRILSTKTAPTIVRGTSYSCIDAEEPLSSPRLEISANADAPVVVTECGAHGVRLWGPGTSATIAGLDARRGSNADGFAGLAIAERATATIENSKFVGVGIGIGIMRGTLTISGRVDVSNNYEGLGVSEGTAVIDGLVANDCVRFGVTCTAPFTKLEMRRSTVLGNGDAGVLVMAGCDAQLGGVDFGNVFNRTSHRNARAGVCFLPNPARPFSATHAAWSCGHVGSTCVSSAAPVVTYTDGCELGADVSLAKGAATPDLSGFTCCP